MTDVIKALIHRFARQTRVNGRLALTSNGDAALVAAFAAIGWADPYPLDTEDAPVEVAAVVAPERAVRPSGTPKVV